MQKLRPAVLIVDMQFRFTSRDVATLAGRPLSEGILGVCDLLSCASARGIPKIIVETPPSAVPTCAKVIESAGEHHRIRKPDFDVFSAPDFVRLVQTLGLDSFILAGFNFSCCVRESVDSARARSMNVTTSPLILFGYADLPKSQLDFTEAYYKRATNYFPNFNDLLAQLPDPKSAAQNHNYQ